MKVIVTGAAGFIGMHVAERLAANGHAVTGLDDFNPYYDPALKRARAARIEERGVDMREMDIAEAEAVRDLFLDVKPDVVVHLAAQAGVRYSLDNPIAYVRSNLYGHTAVLEACRALNGGMTHLVYASSSSVYGGNTKTPFSETDPLADPASFYAATKRSVELLSSSYAQLFGLRQTGLRFFTVYGPWGRPDMAYWLWTDAILKGAPVTLFNHGDMRRDFTFIDDIAKAVTQIAETEPDFSGHERPHRVYNLGNNRPAALDEVVSVLEAAAGRAAKREMAPMQPGDVKETFADIRAAQRDFGFRPTTSIEDGLPKFVAWYRDYKKL